MVLRDLPTPFLCRSSRFPLLVLSLIKHSLDLLTPKMRFSSLPLMALAMAPAATLAWNDWSSCLTDAEAQSIVDRSIIYLQHFNIPEANATAQELFAPGLVEFGDSINSLRGDALGTQVENGRVKYIEDTLSTPPITEIKTIDIIHDCSNISWRKFLCLLFPMLQSTG
jgi:hypothetical protein